jgi:hypothetical protein
MFNEDHLYLSVAQELEMKKLSQGIVFFILAGFACLAGADTNVAPMSASAPNTATPSAAAPASTAPAPAATTAPSATTTKTTTTSTVTPAVTNPDSAAVETNSTSAVTPSTTTTSTTTSTTTKPAADASKCPCDFNQEEFKKFADTMKHGGFICTAQNTRVVGMEDNKPFLSIAMELSAVDKDKRDAANAASDKDALAAATTSWGMVYTSLDNVDPKFKVRICSKTLVADRQAGFQTATQLENFTQYQACLKDILSVATAMNIPCGI